jgi:hypothetical protein
LANGLQVSLPIVKDPSFLFKGRPTLVLGKEIIMANKEQGKNKEKKKKKKEKPAPPKK